MPTRSKAEVERDLNNVAMEVVSLQSELAELEEQRDGGSPPSDLDVRVDAKTTEIEAAQGRWAAIKAEADSTP